MELQAQHPIDLYDGSHPEVRDLTKIPSVIKTLDYLARYYFRTEATGFDNVPDESCLVVGTHNGGICATDMFMFFHAWYRRFGDDKPLYGLGHDIHFRNPYTREWMCQGGCVRANRENALKLLARERHYLAVYPAGAAELFTPVAKRGKVDFRGHKGFIKLALEAQVPIVPKVATGADTFLCLTEGKALAKLFMVDKAFRMPVWPFMLSFPLGFTPGPVPHFPLPGQIRISVGQPIEFNYGPDAAKDPKVVDELYNRVQNTMQGMRDRLERIRPISKPAALPTMSELKQLFQFLKEEMYSRQNAPTPGFPEEHRVAV